MALAAAFTRTHGWDALVFPVGVRLSTWIALAAFVALAAVRREGRPLAAAAAWFFGFEAAYQATALLTGHGLPASGAAAPILIGLGAVVVVVATARGVRPDWRLMLGVAAIWTVWLAVGFPANEPTLVGFSPLAEALNEAAKSVWALAYLLPLFTAVRRAPSDSPGQSKRGRKPRGLLEHDA